MTAKPLANQGGCEVQENDERNREKSCGEDHRLRSLGIRRLKAEIVDMKTKVRDFRSRLEGFSSGRQLLFDLLNGSLEPKPSLRSRARELAERVLRKLRRDASVATMCWRRTACDQYSLSYTLV